MGEVLKANWKVTTVVALAAFIFSILGTVAAQSFIAGQYSETIVNTRKDVDLLKDDFKQHKFDEDKIYMKKEVFEEFEKRRTESLNTINNKLDAIERKLDNLR